MNQEVLENGLCNLFTKFSVQTTNYARKTRTEMYYSRHMNKLTGMITAGLLLFSLCTVKSTYAQGNLVDKREQATGWYVPVTGQVTLQGEKAEGAEITLYKENEEIIVVQTNPKGKYALELDLDAAYSIQFKQAGFQTKMIYMDTSLPKDLVKYPAYVCKVDLLPEGTQQADPFFTDFPSAIVRYDPEMGGFYHSAAYLAHIQAKFNNYASAGN